MKQEGKAQTCSSVSQSDDPEVTRSVAGWESYLAYNRARGVLALERRDGFLYIEHLLETYNAVIFPVGQWSNFYVLFTDPWAEIHGKVPKPHFMHFAWKGSKLVQLWSIALREDPAWRQNKKAPPFSGTLASYLANLYWKPAKPIPDSQLKHGFVEYSEWDLGELIATLFCPDGTTVREWPDMFEIYDYKSLHKPDWPDLEEFVRRYGLPCHVEASKYFEQFFGNSKHDPSAGS